MVRSHLSLFYAHRFCLHYLWYFLTTQALCIASTLTYRYRRLSVVQSL